MALAPNFDVLHNIILQVTQEAVHHAGSGNTDPDYNYSHGTQQGTDFKMLGYKDGYYFVANIFPGTFARRSGVNSVRVVSQVPILFGFDSSKTRSTATDGQSLSYTQYSENSAIDEHVGLNNCGQITSTYVPPNTPSFFRYQVGAKLIIQRLPIRGTDGTTITWSGTAPRVFIAFGKI